MFNERGTMEALKPFVVRSAGFTHGPSFLKTYWIVFDTRLSLYFWKNNYSLWLFENFSIVPLKLSGMWGYFGAFVFSSLFVPIPHQESKIKSLWSNRSKGRLGKSAKWNCNFGIKFGSDVLSCFRNGDWLWLAETLVDWGIMGQLMNLLSVLGTTFYRLSHHIMITPVGLASARFTLSRHFRTIIF